MNRRHILHALLVFLGISILGALKFLYDNASYTPKKSCAETLKWTKDTLTQETLFKVSYEQQPSIRLAQKGGWINDASCLNKTPVAGIVNIYTETDIRNAISFAKHHDLKISIAGQQHTMGGQTFVRGGLVLNMKEFNKILSITDETIIVQSGALWSDLQKALDQKGLSVKAMQSINIFTVGGTVSVNAHGIDHTIGQVGSTIRSIKLLTADGEILQLSKTEREDLFHHVIGGYGLFGVILEVELEHVPNVVYEKKTQYFPTLQFHDWYKEHIQNNESIGLFYARLSIVPGAHFLDEVAVNFFEKKSDETPTLNDQFHNSHIAIKRFIINFSKTGKLGKWFRWYIEKNYSPTSCLTRNQAMSQPDEVCDVTRNTAMYDSMQYLKNNIKDTDILQEYFVPFESFDAFVNELRTIVQEENVNLLNVTIRVLHNDDVSALPYATEDSFGFVLYFNHDLSQETQEKLSKATNRLIDASLELGGTFYLPYQLVYSQESLIRSYPNFPSFIEKKMIEDPSELFSNNWYQTYHSQK